MAQYSETLHIPFVSFLLPVYNGSLYVSSAIQSVLKQSDRDFELIVSIDKSDDDSGNVVKRFHDPRLKVYQHQNRLGMTANYQFLLSKATGQWITIIGQDDALLPFSVGKLRKIVDMFPSHEIVSSRRAFAFWPNTNKQFGRFSFIYPIDRRKPRLVNSTKFLTQSISGFREYSEGPQLYTGSFIKKSLIETITQKNNGLFFTYPIPDVSSSVSFLLNTHSFVYSPLPLFIIGTSSQSTGLAIDQVIKSKSDLDTNRSISDFFSNSLTSTSPGEGLFTSFSWYIYEAYRETVKYHPAERPAAEQAKFVSAALVALRIESKRSNLYTNDQKVRYKELRLQFNVSYFVIIMNTCKLIFLKTLQKIGTLINAFLLLLTGRLVLMSNRYPNIFLIEDFCERVNLLVTYPRLTDNIFNEK